MSILCIFFLPFFFSVSFGKQETLFVTPKGQGSCSSSDSRCDILDALTKINSEGYSDVIISVGAGEYDVEDESPTLLCTSLQIVGEGNVGEAIISLSFQMDPFLRFAQGVDVQISKVTFSRIEREILSTSNKALQLTIKETNFINGSYPLIRQSSGLSSLNIQNVHVNTWSNGFISFDRNLVDVTITANEVFFKDLSNTSPFLVFSNKNKIEGTFSQLVVDNSEFIFHPGSGLGLYGSSVSITLTQATMTGNSMVPIHLNGTNEVSLTIDGSSRFSDNFGFYGGAIWLESPKGTVTLNMKDTIFERNEAQFMGGAIRILSTKPVTYTSTRVTFTDNHCHESGGTVHIEQQLVGKENLGISRISIVDDTYEGSYTEIHYGGVFWINTAILELTVNGSDFTNNEAGFPMVGQGQQLGGVFKVSTYDSLILDVHHNMFFKNTGQEGGVFYIDNMDVSVNILRLSHNNFTLNRAYDEDCEYICQTGRGGVFFLMFTQGSTNTTEVTVTLDMRYNHFEKNSAVWNGGVVYIFENDEYYSLYSVYMEKNTFIENTAWGSGGAGFFFQANGMLVKNHFERNVIGTSLFARYEANGGGLVWNGGIDLTFGKGNVWDGNVASHYGGAAHLLNIENVEILEGVVIENNVAYGGGGLYLENLQNAKLYSKISGNMARYGGGLVIDFPSSENSLHLYNDISKNIGGGIYALNGNGLDENNLKKYVTGNFGGNLVGAPVYVEKIRTTGDDPKKDNVCIKGGKDNYFWNCTITVLRFIDLFGEVLIGQTMEPFDLTFEVVAINPEQSFTVFTQDTLILKISFLPQTQELKILSGVFDTNVYFEGSKQVMIQIYFNNNGNEPKSGDNGWILYMVLIIILVFVLFCCLCCLTCVVCFGLARRVRKSVKELNDDDHQIQIQDEDHFVDDDILQYHEQENVKEEEEEEEEERTRLINEQDDEEQIQKDEEILGEHGYQTL